jgi:cytochrome P450
MICHDLIASPCKSSSISHIFTEMNSHFEKGKLLILYKKYQLQFGDDGLSSNLLVPYYDTTSTTNKDTNITSLIIINDARDAERLVNKHIKKMPNLKPLFYDSIISTTDTEHWGCQRKKYQAAFSIVDKLKPLIPISNTRAKKCTHLLWELTDDGKKEVNINEFFLNETMAQLQLAMFGFSDDFQDRTNKNIRDTFSGINKEYHRCMVPDLLNEIKISSGPLSDSMNSHNSHSSHNSELKTDTEDKGNALIFSFAGHDTTGNTLTWLIYELAKNRQYQTILQDEVDQFWNQQQDTPILYSDFKRLPFMTKCIMETLRLWTPLPNGTFRELIEDDYIHGLNDKKVPLSKGTFIQIPNWSRHMNPSLWGEDVDIFNPYREFKDAELWDNSIINTYNPSTERFSPFTYGPRDCIGKNFSQIEMRLILLQLLHKFNFKLTGPQLTTYTTENISYNKLTMGPRNIYNKKLEDNRQGMYVHIQKRLLTQGKL